MVYKDKLWVKFKDLDIYCFCAYNDRRCAAEKREDCHLYLTKFIRIDDVERHDERVKNLSDASRILEAKIKREQKRFESQVKRSIKKFKI